MLVSVALGLVAALLAWQVRADALWLLAVLPMLVALSAYVFLKGQSGREALSSQEASESCVSPNQCQAALSAAGVGALLWDVESGELHCANDVFAILGRPSEPRSFSADDFKRAVHSEDRTAFERAVEGVMAGTRRSPIDCRFVKPGGGVVWVQLTLCLVDGRHGQGRIAGAMTEVTERKFAEMQLDRGVAYLEAILENTKNIVFSIDSDFRLTVFNTRFLANMKAAYGTRVNVGENVLEVPSKSIARVWKPRFDRALGGESFRLEETFEVKGRTFAFDVSLRPIRENGRVVGATVYSRDVTEQKVREKEWVEAKERAEESDRLKSAFLANMSHEIRTPLNAVMGFAQLLKTGGGTEEEREKFIDIILSNGDHLLRILGDIIELAQIESNQLRVEPAMFDLRQMLVAIYSAFHDRIQAIDGNPVELVLESQIQDSDFVMCDETRLKQIVYNLVSNALKFTSEGSIRVGYERKEGGILEFYVADTGTGVPEEMRERIFKRFRQGAVHAGQRNDGVGLGLSICQGLVGLLGGTIWLEDNPPNGCVFRFTVRDCSSEAERRAYLARASGERAALSGSAEIREGSKVLVAEDDDMNFKVVDELLRKEKLVSVRAENGADAVAAVENDREIKLVVMDISMPVLDGLEATKKIKLLRPDLPVIAHTAHAMREDLDRAMDAGCSDCLVKPISIENFKALLARYV